MRYTKVDENAFKEIQVNAGVICKTFTPTTGEMDDILGATTNGYTFKAEAKFSDWGADIDNVPENTKELKRLEGYTAKASGTYVTFTKDMIRTMIAAADISGNKIVPRDALTDDDFEDIWLVGDYSEYNGETKGGYMAIHLMNALSTGGFEWKTANKGKGTSSFEYTAHYSLEDITKIPFEVYVVAGTAETA